MHLRIPSHYSSRLKWEVCEDPTFSPLLTLNICQMSAWCLLGLGAGLVLASCLLCHSLKIKDIKFQMRSHFKCYQFCMSEMKSYTQKIFMSTRRLQVICLHANFLLHTSSIKCYIYGQMKLTWSVCIQFIPSTFILYNEFFEKINSAAFHLINEWIIFIWFFLCEKKNCKAKIRGLISKITSASQICWACG